MLCNVSYKNPRLDEMINEEVGRSYGFIDRIKLRGIGSPKLWIKHSSEEITALLELDHYANTCNIELRPKGIILRFRSILETYGLVIPYPMLSIYKSDLESFSISSDQHHVVIDDNSEDVRAFLFRIKGYQANYASNQTVQTTN